MLALDEAMTRLEGLPEEQAGQWLRVAWFLVLLVFFPEMNQQIASRSRSLVCSDVVYRP